MSLEFDKPDAVINMTQSKQKEHWERSGRLAVGASKAVHFSSPSFRWYPQNRRRGEINGVLPWAGVAHLKLDCLTYPFVATPRCAQRFRRLSTMLQSRRTHCGVERSPCPIASLLTHSGATL